MIYYTNIYDYDIITIDKRKYANRRGGKGYDKIWTKGRVKSGTT